MAEQFGRANSTRWATAEVPSYDDWGEDYVEENSALHDVIEEESDEEVVAPKFTSPKTTTPPVEPLVLSIDDPSDDDEDEDEHEDEAPRTPTFERSSSPVYDSPVNNPEPMVTPKKRLSRKAPKREPEESVADVEEDSYESDDSIQVEHTLNVASPNKRKSLLIDPHKLEEEFYDEESVRSLKQASVKEVAPVKEIPKSEPMPAPIPMFVINNDFDKDIETDDWGTPREDTPPAPVPAPVPVQVKPEPKQEKSKPTMAPIMPPSFVISHDYDKSMDSESETWGTVKKVEAEDKDIDHFVVKKKQTPSVTTPQATVPQVKEPSATSTNPYETARDYDNYENYSINHEYQSREKDHKNKHHPPSDDDNSSNDDFSHQESDNHGESVNAYEYDGPASNYNSVAEPSSPKPQPLVLSIDNDDDSSDSDNWGAASDSSSDEEIIASHQPEQPIRAPEDFNESREFDSGKEFHSGDEYDVDDIVPKTEIESPVKDLHISRVGEEGKSVRKPVDTSMLDNLMYDIENVSYGEGSDGDSVLNRDVDLPEPVRLEKRDASNDQILPEFNTSEFGNSFAKYLEQEFDVEKESSPITPLSPEKSEAMHEQFVRTLSDRRASIRKPPNPRQALVSMDYTHIADAMSNYIDESGSKSSLTGSLAERKEGFPEPKRPGTAGTGTGTSDVGSMLSSEASFKENDENNIRVGRDDMAPPVRPGLDSRRSSASTLNFGQWNPNTSNFRDKFVNDNTADDEGVIDNEAVYSKFTGGDRKVSDQSSIPETIDVAMPRIEEDYSDDEVEPRRSMDTTATGFSSVFNNPPTKPVFHEERLTPNPSMEEITEEPQKYSSLLDNNFPEKPKYSSLLGNDDGKLEDEGNTRDRSVSNATNATAQSVGTVVQESRVVSHSRTSSGNTIPGTPVVVPTPIIPSSGSMPSTASMDRSQISFKPGSYPVSDWKKIMSLSQPKDKISELKEAIVSERNYDTGLETWMSVALKQQSGEPTMTNGRIATEAYQNAAHVDIRRHNSIQPKQVIGDVKESMLAAAPAARSFGKKFLNKSKNLMKKTN